MSVLRAVLSVPNQQTCETSTQFGSRLYKAALSMDQRIVWEDQTRTSEFGDEHAFVIDDVKVFGVVRESCAFDVTGKIDGHEMGEEGIGKAAPTNVPPGPHGPMMCSLVARFVERLVDGRAGGFDRAVTAWNRRCVNFYQ